MLDPDHRTYRIISRSESGDFTDFPPPVEIMAPRDDEIQDYLSNYKSRNGTDLYNSSAMKYEYAKGVYFLFPSYFHHDTDEVVIHIATGRDSVHFTRHDEPLIRPEDAPLFRAPQQYLGCGMLPSNDDALLLYANAYSVGHDELSQVQKRETAITGYEFQKDGFIGQYAEDGTLETKPLSIPDQCRQMTIRAKIEQGGHIDASIHGHDVAFTYTLAANGGVVMQTVLPDVLSEFRLRIHAVKSTVFSIELN